MKNNIDNLLARYFGGNASAEDMQWLENWLSASPESQKYFDQMTALFEKLPLTSENVPAPKTVEAKKAFMKYISENETSKPVIEFKKKSFYNSWIFRVAGIIIIILLSATAYYQINSEKEIIFATEKTAKKLLLPDETNVQLSENSKIVYSSNFSKKDKNIQLSGEASFIVGHKGNGKLKVNAGETFIEDIGTVFEVKALPESDIVSVSVKEGKVHFYTLTDKGLILNSTETGIYNKKSKMFSILAQQSNNGISGSKHIDFQNVALSDAIDIISNAYNIDIKLAENSLENRRITVNFDGEDVDIVLQIMTETLNLNLEKSKNGYQLSKRN